MRSEIYALHEIPDMANCVTLTVWQSDNKNHGSAEAFSKDKLNVQIPIGLFEQGPVK